jgi:hypothetical protein
MKFRITQIKNSTLILAFMAIFSAALLSIKISDFIYNPQSPILIQIQINGKKFLNSKCECRKNELIYLQLKDHLIIYSFDQIKSETKYLYSISVEEFEKSKFTCDMYSLLRRGKSQKVISYSLYGTNQFYYKKLKVIVKQMKKFYPDWSMRIFHDNSINRTIKCEIECLKNDENNNNNNETYFDNVDFCNIETDLKLNPKILKNNQHQNEQTSFTFAYTQLNLSYVHAMMWRFLPIGDSFVNVFSSRDTDSFILQREVDSVNIWLDSNKIGHIMRGK